MRSYTLKNGNYKAVVSVTSRGLLVELILSKRTIGVRLCGSAPVSAEIYAKAWVNEKIMSSNFSMNEAVGIFEVREIKTQG